MAVRKGGAKTKASRKSETSTFFNSQWAPWLTDPDPDQPEMSDAQADAAAKNVKALMEKLARERK